MSSTDPNSICNEDTGERLIHFAAKKGSPGCLIILLQSPDIIVSVQDRNGNTALHHAASSVHAFPCVRLLLSSSKIKELIHVKNCDGDTALKVAEKEENVMAAKTLQSFVEASNSSQ
eukprot:Colp12_sorted_trinity150504_noHs@29622